MTETDKPRIKALDDKSDYALWRIRVKAAISAKGLDVLFQEGKVDVPTKEGEPSTSKSAADAAKDEQCQQASNIIVSTLGDHALRVVRAVIGSPKAMMKKLDDRFDSKTIASRISKMSELVSIRYTTLRDDIDKHIDKLAGLME